MPVSSRFYEPPDWRFVVTDLYGTTLTFLDRFATSRTATFTLNKPGTCTMTVPADNPEVNLVYGTGTHHDGEPFVSMENRLIYGFRRDINIQTAWTVRGGWIMSQLQDQIVPSTDVPSTHISGFDCWQNLMMQPVMNASGVLPGRSGLSFSNTAANTIVLALLNNWYTYNQALVTGGFTMPPASVCGYLNWGQSNFLGGGGGANPFFSGTIQNCVPVSVNFRQGTMIGDALDTLTNKMGACDIIFTPVYDPHNQPGIINQINIYQLAGNNQYNAVFAWDKPSRSLLGMSRMNDGQQMVNIAQGYAGQGGDPVFTVGYDELSYPVSIGYPNAASVAKYGPHWLQQFYPSLIASPAAVALLMQAQLILRARGKVTLTVDTAPELAPIPFQEYYIGDFVPVYASKNFRQPLTTPFTGATVLAANAVTFPLTVVTGTNDQFVFNGNTYTLAAGTYTQMISFPQQASDLVAAIQAATGAPSFKTLIAVSDNGSGKVFFTSLQPLAQGQTVNTGTHDVLAGLGFTNGQALASPKGGMQRIYEIPVVIPDDSPEQVSTLLMTVPDLTNT